MLPETLPILALPAVPAPRASESAVSAKAPATRQWVLATVATAGAFLAWEVAGGDRWLADMAGTAAGFALRNHWLLDNVVHSVGRLLAWALARSRRIGQDRAGRVLLIFILPLLTLVSLQALTGRANGSGQFKSGNLTVTATTAASSSANKTAALNITQEAAPVTDTGCSNLYLTRENERQGPNTINASLGVRASTTSCTWTVQSDQSWVVIQQGANGKGSGSVLYQVEANAGTSERKATLTIRGAQGAQAQTLTIYQSSNATNVALTGGNEGGGAGDGGGDGGGVAAAPGAEVALARRASGPREGGEEQSAQDQGERSSGKHDEPAG